MEAALILRIKFLFYDTPLAQMKPEDFIKIRKPRGLFHFTDLRNLASIRRHGLLSVAELERLNITPPKPGGNDWSREADARANLQYYVHLALVDNHPMEFCARESGHIGEVRYLKINPRILLLPGVMGCATVANKAGAVILPIEDALDAIDVEILFFGKKLNFGHIPTRNRYNTAKKAEILIPSAVPLEYIQNLN